MFRLRALGDGGARQYRVLRTLGEGSFGKVKLALHAATGTEVAIKIIDKASQKRPERLAREVGCMKMLRHPNIIRLFEAVDTRDRLLLVMEFAGGGGGDLHGYLRWRGRLDEREARLKFAQAAAAVAHCHARGVAHRDLKPQNLLLDREHNLKLADFGLSSARGGEALRTFCGSPHCAAPEIYLQQAYAGPAADVWSLGVVLYRMVAGTLPFQGATLRQIRSRVLSGLFHLPYFLSAPCRDLLGRMMALDPKGRISMAAVLQHPWVRPKMGLLTSPEPPVAGPATPSDQASRHSAGSRASLQVEDAREDSCTHTARPLREDAPEPSAASVPSPQGEDSCTPTPRPLREDTPEPSAPSVPGPQGEDSCTPTPRPLREDAPEPSAASIPGPQGEDSSTSIAAPLQEDAPEPSVASVPGPQESKNQPPAPQPAPSNPRPPPSRHGWISKIRRNAVAPIDSLGPEDRKNTSVPPSSSSQGGRGRGSMMSALRKLCSLCRGHRSKRSNRVHPCN